MKKLLVITTAIVACTLGSVAHAEYLGLPHGRSADLTKLSDLSLEGGFITGDFYDADYDHFGLRINYRVSPGMIAYGDLGKTDIGNVDATSFGIGLYYQLQDLIDNMDAALRGSFHTGDFDGDDGQQLVLDVLFSGREPLSDNGLEWYGSLGIHRFSADNFSETDLGFGGGLLLPVGAGEAYFGIEHVDDITFGFGFRYDI